MAIPHGPKCFCDACIAQRTRLRIAERDRKKDADAYVKRRDRKKPKKEKE